MKKPALQGNCKRRSERADPCPVPFFGTEHQYCRLHPLRQICRSCFVWHGDTSPIERACINREQPDILLTTPESIEVMLVSRETDPVALFGRVRAVIVDELHALAGDDRGWHLLSVLQRVSHISSRNLQLR